MDYGESFQEETLADGVYVNKKEAILVKRVKSNFACAFLFGRQSMH